MDDIDGSQIAACLQIYMLAVGCVMYTHADFPSDSCQDPIWAQLEEEEKKPRKFKTPLKAKSKAKDKDIDDEKPDKARSIIESCGL